MKKKDFVDDILFAVNISEGLITKLEDTIYEQSGKLREKDDTIIKLKQQLAERDKELLKQTVINKAMDRAIGELTQEIAQLKERLQGIKGE